MLLNSPKAHDIPLNNMVGFAADGASNIMGRYNSISSRLRAAAPGITVFKCVAHSIHLCSSEAAKTLPRSCEDLLRNVYNFFDHSAKRTSELNEFQVFCEVKPHKLLHSVPRGGCPFTQLLRNNSLSNGMQSNYISKAGDWKKDYCL